jgi:acetolactate synthase-1/2/3 large subunit
MSSRHTASRAAQSSPFVNDRRPALSSLPATMIRLADYVANTLVARGVTDVFMVTGGGAMHLNDALGSHPSLRYTCCHHEQACAMAAEAYARVTGRMAAVNVTTGPGGINAINGVFGAWTDSVPMLIVSGQVKRETMVSHYDLPDLRQLGDQEADIVAMVRGITKYAVVVTDPTNIRYHLERAIHLATTGRPGPCWLDIPIDVQAAKIDPDALRGYDPAEDAAASAPTTGLADLCNDVLDRLTAAERPVLLAGSGVWLAGAERVFDRVVHKLRIPVTTAWTAPDLIDSDDDLFCGRPGSIGDRAGNFTVQNSDVLLVLGSRLNIRQVSYNWKTFARRAFIMQVDADPAELRKPTVKPHLPLHCDLRAFLEELERQIDIRAWDALRAAAWVDWCRARVLRYPTVLPRHRQPSAEGQLLNPYHFLDVMYRQLRRDDVVVCGDGSACVITFHLAHLKRGQRLWCNSGSASMGYDLPGAIGAAVGRGGKRVICLAGDGSVQMNIQELQTVVHNQLPITIFVLNNGGYLSIRQSQSSFFGRLVGEGATSGVSFPDMVKVAEAYGIPSVRITAANYVAELDRVLAGNGPQLCEVMLEPAQIFEPKLSSRALPDGRIVSPPLEDLYPFLERAELLENLLIPAMED